VEQDREVVQAVRGPAVEQDREVAEAVGGPAVEQDRETAEAVGDPAGGLVGDAVRKLSMARAKAAKAPAGARPRENAKSIRRPAPAYALNAA
jgi:hypothetical protein